LSKLAVLIPSRCVNELKGAAKRSLRGELTAGAGWSRRASVVTVVEVEEVKRLASEDRWGAAAVLVPNASINRLERLIGEKKPFALFPREARKAVSEALRRGGVDAVEEEVSRQFPEVGVVALANEVMRQKLSGRSVEEDEALCAAMRTAPKGVSAEDQARWQQIAAYALVTGLLYDGFIDECVRSGGVNWGEIAQAMRVKYPGMLVPESSLEGLYTALWEGGETVKSVKEEVALLEKGEAVAWVERGLEQEVSPMRLATHSYLAYDALMATWSVEEVIQLRNAVAKGGGQISKCTAILTGLFPKRTKEEVRAMYRRAKGLDDGAISRLPAWRRRPWDASKTRNEVAHWEQADITRLVLAVEEEGPAWRKLSRTYFEGRSSESLRMQMRNVWRAASKKFGAVEDRAMIKAILSEGEANVNWDELASVLSTGRVGKEVLTSSEVLARWLAIRGGDEALSNVLVEQLALQPDARPDVSDAAIEALVKTTDEEVLGWTPE
jgi:hypothetical protein